MTSPKSEIGDASRGSSTSVPSLSETISSDVEKTGLESGTLSDNRNTETGKDFEKADGDDVGNAAPDATVAEAEYPTGVRLIVVIVALMSSIFLVALDMVSSLI